MKKIFAFLILAILIFSFVACSPVVSGTTEEKQEGDPYSDLKREISEKAVELGIDLPEIDSGIIIPMGRQDGSTTYFFKIFEYYSSLGSCIIAYNSSNSMQIFCKIE